MTITMRRAALLSCFTLMLVPALAAAAPLSASSRVGPTGVGPIVFGSTPAQAQASGARFTTTNPASGSTCFYLRPSTLSGLSFMVEAGTIRRAEITTHAVSTTDGFRVGDPVSKIKSFYGQRASAAPDKYDPQAQTITIAPKDGAETKYRMIYNVKGAIVRSIFAGALPQVQYVESCS